MSKKIAPSIEGTKKETLICLRIFQPETTFPATRDKHDLGFSRLFLEYVFIKRSVFLYSKQ